MSITFSTISPRAFIPQPRAEIVWNSMIKSELVISYTISYWYSSRYSGNSYNKSDMFYKTPTLPPTVWFHEMLSASYDMIIEFIIIWAKIFSVILASALHNFCASCTSVIAEKCNFSLGWGPISGLEGTWRKFQKLLT